MPLAREAQNSRCRMGAMTTVQDQLRRALQATQDVRLAVLFGSAASGRPRPDSDIDIGVSLRPDAGRPAALDVELERAAGRSVDLVWLDDAPPLLRFEIARSGIVLVERAPYAWVDFRARAMIDWWDWAPTARMMHAAMCARLHVEARRGSS
jgi:predicted nucleotidyltransferase